MNNHKLISTAFIASTTLLFGCQTTDITQTLSDYGFPVPNQSEQSGTGTKVLAGASGLRHWRSCGLLWH